jgi:alpha-galactosidase/6-phospho-beta-glucosidase family protein
MTALRIQMAIPLLLAGLWAHAQTPPEQYFNKAAREYVKEDRITALRTLDEGLRAHPGDARMRRLAEAILKEQQQQQQSNQQQNQDQKNQDQQEQEREQQKEQEEGNEQEQRAEEREQQQRRQQPGELSKEEAERMLDALERREQDVQNQVRSKLRPARRASIEKDW